MNDGNREGLAELHSLVEETVQLVEEFPEKYQPEILGAVLSHRLGDSPVGESAAGRRRARTPRPPQKGGLAAIADAADVPSDRLRRILEVNDEEREVKILVPRVGGNTISEQQNRFSALFCFAREKAFKENKTDIEDLRDLCDQRGCYDSSNFTKNFRNQDLLREVPGDDAQDRKYLLSEKGVAKARDLLQELIED